MRLYKISLGNEYFNDKSIKFLSSKKLITVHPDTSAKGQSYITQGENFLTTKKGDVFYACRSNKSILFIGMFTDSRPLYSLLDGFSDWTDKSYEILFESKNPSDYDNGFDKWWSPKNNSTFIEVPKTDFKVFETNFLKPVFDISLEQLIEKRKAELTKIDINIEQLAELQQRFQNYKNDGDLIFNDINNLSDVEIAKNLYNYSYKGIESQPVVLLRKTVLEKLENGEKLDIKKLNDAKEIIGLNFEKNVFHAWKAPFRILYPVIYHQYKNDYVNFLNSLIEKLRNDLGIIDKTNFNLVHLDGPQNQGSDRIWFAIYNNTYSSQKLAKQLFFSIYNGFEYGLLDYKNPKNDRKKKTDTFNYEDVLETFKKYKQEILNDSSMENAYLGKIVDLIEYKKQIILQGPPGTGKTKFAKEIAEVLTNENQDRIELIQFHPAYTYEDFVRGISVENNGKEIEYKTVNRIIARMAATASEDANKEKKYVLIIDEINRANLPSVLGELIYGLEYRDKEFGIIYKMKDEANSSIKLPSNLYVIGTMNTADRSVAHIDYAIRRRFAFVELLPKILSSNDEFIFKYKSFKEVSRLFVNEISEKSTELTASEFLSLEFKDRPQDVWLGHSYFISTTSVNFKIRIEFEIIPILKEYVKDGILKNSESVHQIINNLINIDE